MSNKIQQSPNLLAATILDLIAKKQQRDHKRFTASTLAEAIQLDRSSIMRILSGDVKHPRVDTLKKIAQFFIDDGFNLRFDDILGLSPTLIDIRSQAIPDVQPLSIPLYPMNDFNSGKIGNITVNFTDINSHLFALISDEAIKPIFNAGSIFIIDSEKQPSIDNLIAVNIHHKIQIRKCAVIKNVKVLLSLNDEEPPINFDTVANNDVIGVIVRINAKT